MLVKRREDIKPSEITSKDDLLNWHQFPRRTDSIRVRGNRGRRGSKNYSAGHGENELPPYDDVTSYNDFYEFGTDKGDPKANADKFKLEP